MIFTTFCFLTYGFFGNLWYNIWTIKREAKERGANMIYNALDVARYIIDYEATQGRTVSNLRLQKLLYFIQAQFIANTPNESPCFSERMEAWDFGPVVPCVYREYKYCGSAAIPPEEPNTSIFLPTDRELINSMLDYCGHMTTSTLVDITHAQDPWCNAYHNFLGNEITLESMRDYFGEVQ